MVVGLINHLIYLSCPISHPLKQNVLMWISHLTWIDWLLPSPSTGICKGFHIFDCWLTSTFHGYRVGTIWHKLAMFVRNQVNRISRSFSFPDISLNEMLTWIQLAQNDSNINPRHSIHHAVTVESELYWFPDLLLVCSTRGGVLREGKLQQGFPQKTEKKWYKKIGLLECTPRSHDKLHFLKILPIQIQKV